MRWAGSAGRSPEAKHGLILARERSLAKTVALAVVKTKPITVWEFMVPLIFIMNYAKMARMREWFTENFLFTKKLALDGALDMKKNGSSREEALSRIEGKTLRVLAAAEKGIYSEEIRRAQVKEIELLIGYYGMLLEAEGKDFPGLLRNAYRTREEYSSFLEELKAVEGRVSAAAREIAATEGGIRVASTIEETAERVRTVEANRIFGTL